MTNKKLLYKLLSFTTPHGTEERIVDIINPILKKLGFITAQDSKRNLYAVRDCEQKNPQYVLLSAHMDTVHFNKFPTRVNIIRDGSIWHTGGTSILGADDKAGIVAALAIAEYTPDTPMKIFFSVGEETGCIGANFAVKHHSSFFRNIEYGLVLDRKGENHILPSQLLETSCSGRFLSKFLEIVMAKNYPFLVVDGSLSDTYILKQIVPNMVNLSVGYELEHTRDEYLNVSTLDKLVQLYIAIVEQLDLSQPFGEFKDNQFEKYYGALIEYYDREG